ncbi:anthrone oxygenase family protein [Streptosporangium sp. CA-135522]|uniref:anthrone oxygenase family protein n=1 Tax=Streptosporangium sp. CA-135522 TaxID=3240072 RepID=UPI003D90198C
MLAQVLGVVALVGCGVVAGVFVAVAVSVLPALIAMPADRYIEAHRLLGKGYHPLMPLLVNATMLTEIALAIMREGGARPLFATGAVLLLGTQFVSHLCNVPINRSLHEIDVSAIPADWDDPRPLWRGWHLLRTALALAALTVTGAGAVLLA